MRKILSKFFKKYNSENSYEIMKNIDIQSILTAKILIHQQKLIKSKNINDYEFRVFSQFGDDGIIQYLINNVEIKKNERKFIEIGVGDYSESNTRFLLMKDYWKGLILDGSKQILTVKKKYYDLIWKNKLKVGYEWITKDNINEVFQKYKFDNDVGVLSIDVDGNDYWIWKNINIINPIIIVIEYNSLFGKKNKTLVPYFENFQRNSAHKSGLYWGSSISALVDLGKSKGYDLVGGNSAGVNLYFVRNDRRDLLNRVDIEDAYFEQKFSDIKDDNGNFLDITYEEKLNLIKDLKLFDLTNNKLVKISEILSKL
jgi:hypothetical protein